MTFNLKISSIPPLPAFAQQSVDELLSWWGESVARKGVQNVPRWVWVGGSVLGAVLCFRYYYQSTYGVWKTQGVPGPTPWPLMGTTLSLLGHKDFFAANAYLADRYGEKGYFGHVF